MNVAVLTAYRLPQSEVRYRLWNFCRPRWQDCGFPVIEGINCAEPYNRANARNRAADLAGEWDVALVADADIILGDQTRQALEATRRAHETGRLVYLHDHLTMLEETETRAVLGGAHPAQVAGKLTRHPNTWSQALAVPRALWEAVGGYDERFQDWGWEDLAFMSACNALGGIERVKGDAYHLWHPRSWETNEGNPHHGVNSVLGQRYLAAKANPDAIRAILAER